MPWPGAGRCGDVFGCPPASNCSLIAPPSTTCWRPRDGGRQHTPGVALLRSPGRGAYHRRALTASPEHDVAGLPSSAVTTRVCAPRDLARMRVHRCGTLARRRRLPHEMAAVRETGLMWANAL